MKVRIFVVAALAVVSGAASSACGGGDNETHGPQITGTGDDDDGGGGGSCSSRASSASSSVSTAVKAADTTCTTDADCTQIVPSTECATACAAVTSLTGAASIRSAIASANSGSCSNFTVDGCTATAPTTCPTLAGAACVSGKCQAGSPSSWQSITMFDRVPDTEMVTDPDAPCQPGETCESWTVTPDGKVARDTATADTVDATTSTLSAADLMTVSMLFTVSPAPESALSCGSVPSGTTTSYLLDVDRGGNTSYADVTGCIVTGPALNVAAELYGVLKSY